MLPLLASQAAAARDLLPPEVLAFIEGGGVATREAETAWGQFRLRPRVLRDVSAVDTALTLYGTELATPVLVAPTAFHGRLHPLGEQATSAGAARAGSLFVAATRSDRPVAELTRPFWWQSYVLKDRAHTLDLAMRARDAGATAVVVTGDTPYLAPREGGLRVPLGEHEQDPAATLAVLHWLAAETGLPVLVKGVLRGDDARECLAAGASGIIVSNHGGRQLDRAAPTAAVLAEVVEAVAGAAPVLVDGGLRSGVDVLCALALGATAVLLGKPVLYALAAGGAEGVRACLEAVSADLAAAMALAGCVRLNEVDRSLLSER
jgi:4-hydroxymandelate oxidase